MNTKNYDMLLINLPWADLQVPYCAPAVLKGIAESAGYKIKTHDFNIDFRFDFCSSQQQFEELQEYFISVDNDSTDIINSFYDHIINRVKKENPRYLGISVFSVWTHKSTFQLCKRIKEQCPEIKIVLGGRGLTAKPHLSIKSELTSVEKLELFSTTMLRRKYADYAILGDAEDAIVDFLNNNEYSDTTVKESKKLQLDYPFSNYDDYKLHQYSGIAGRPQLVVISSKGCVRDCDFCDVTAQFSKFKSKDGNRLAEEMIYLANKYNIFELATADSILNGNLKELKKTLHTLAEYNQQAQENKKIKWGGNWICRPVGAIKPEFFKSMAAAGCVHLTVGAESGSNRVLEAMNKKTTVEGLYYEIDQMSASGIKCGLNHVIAHWSEHEQDFDDHIDMILNLGSYYANNTVTDMYLGSGFSLLMDTPADKNRSSNHLSSINDNFSFVWYTDLNPNLTIKVRAARVLTVYKICRYLNIPIVLPYQGLLNLRNRLKETLTTGIEFIEAKVNKEKFNVCPTLALLDTYRTVVNKKLQQSHSNINLCVAFKASSCNTDPELELRYGTTVHKKTYASGMHTLELTLSVDSAVSSLLLAMTNKNPYDTTVDQDGNIVEDKSIEFTSVVVNGVDVFKDQHYWFNVLTHRDGDVVLPIGRSGFWGNSSVEIPTSKPIWVEYLQSKSTASWYINSEPQKIDALISEIEQIVDRIPK